jgi:hypothetical protein
MTNLRSLPKKDKRRAWELMNTVQRYKICKAVKKLLPSVQTEPPWVWLAHILMHPEYKTILTDALPHIPTCASDLENMYNDAIVQILMQNTDEHSLAQRILALDQDCRAEKLIEKLQRVGVHGIDLWAKELWRVLGDEQFQDLYVEGHYAYKLAINRLEVELNPPRRKGPDLRVSSNAEGSIFIEVTRFRQDRDIQRQLYEADMNPKSWTRWY